MTLFDVLSVCVGCCCTTLGQQHIFRKNCPHKAGMSMSVLETKVGSAGWSGACDEAKRELGSHPGHRTQFLAPTLIAFFFVNHTKAHLSMFCLSVGAMLLTAFSMAALSAAGWALPCGCSCEICSRNRGTRRLSRSSLWEKKEFMDVAS